MGDPELTKKAIEGLMAQLEYEEKRIRTISREEAREEAIRQRNELVDEVNQVVKEIVQEIATLQHDLKWILAATRAYRAMRERVARWRRVFDWLVKMFTGK